MASEVRYGGAMRVLIVGGGIAGLTLAGLLHQRGFAPDVVERAHAYSGAGYVLGLWPAGANIMKGLGLYERYLAASAELRRYTIADHRGRPIRRYDLSPVAERFGEIRLIERARLIEVLRAGLGDLPVRLGTTVGALAQHPDGVEVALSDGSTACYDLVVGADGLRSRVRELLFGPVPLHYCGLTGWACWLRPGTALPEGVTEYWGRGRFLGIYPARDAVCAFLARPAPEGRHDPPEGRVERLRRDFGDLGGGVPALLAGLEHPEDTWHDDFLDVALPAWCRGRVALLGDAAHAILPTGGVGASMAMESAAVLADELTRSDSRRVELALGAYVARRRRRVDRIQRQSRQLGGFAVVENGLVAALRDAAVRRLPERLGLRFFDAWLAQPI